MITQQSLSPFLYLLLLLLRDALSLPVIPLDNYARFTVDARNLTSVRGFQSVCENEKIRTPVQEVLSTEGNNVDKIQLKIEASLARYLAMEGGSWLISVFAFSRFDMVASPIMADLLTSSIVFSQNNFILVIIAKLL